ncbi:hypothetical protein GCM10020219_075240 [Nonomuraea dietziae]
MIQPTGQQTAAQEPHPARWRILGFLGVAQLMLILDVTVVAIALPHIETDLGLSREALTWTVSAYTLTFGGLMLLGGRITDLLGAKRVVIAGLLLFTTASLIAGLAGSAGMLVGGRVAQGVGAALLSPAALSLVVAMFDGEERNRALGVWSALGGGGAALGVLLGGGPAHRRPRVAMGVPCQCAHRAGDRRGARGSAPCRASGVGRPAPARRSRRDLGDVRHRVVDLRTHRRR